MTFEQARWRLQLLAEMGIGWQVRGADLLEDAQIARLPKE